jgi:hypothetical protein
MLARLEIFGNEEANFNLVVSDFLERGAVDVEAIKASSWRSIVKRSHAERLSC